MEDIMHFDWWLIVELMNTLVVYVKPLAQTDSVVTAYWCGGTLFNWDDIGYQHKKLVTEEKQLKFRGIDISLHGPKITLKRVSIFIHFRTSAENTAFPRPHLYHASFLPVTIQPCKYELGLHQRSHLRGLQRSQRGRKTLLDFTKEVNRWTQKREERWEMDEKWYFFCAATLSVRPQSRLMNTFMYLPD